MKTARQLGEPRRTGQLIHVDSRRSQPRHAVPVRSSDRARAAGHQAAARTSLPHPHRELFAQGDAGRALRELAAGPERKLARALRISAEGTRAHHRGRPRRRHGGDQSFRFLRRAVRGNVSIRVSGRVRRGAGALSRCRAGRPAAVRAARLVAARSVQHRRFPGHAQSTSAVRDPLSHPHGNRRAGSGGDAGGALGFLPRQCLAPGAGSASSRSRRALRLRLPHPVAAGRRSRSKGRPARRRISPICTLGQRSTCRVPAGSGSMPRRGCCAAKAIFRSRQRLTSVRRLRSRARSSPAR